MLSIYIQLSNFQFRIAKTHFGLLYTCIIIYQNHEIGNLSLLRTKPFDTQDDFMFQILIVVQITQCLCLSIESSPNYPMSIFVHANRHLQNLLNWSLIWFVIFHWKFAAYVHQIFMSCCLLYFICIHFI